MIIELKKYLIFGPKEEMDRFFTLAQRAGFLEFIGVSHKKSLELTDDIKTLLAAIKIAKRYSIHPHQAPTALKDPISLSQRIIECHTTIEHLREEERVITAEMARIAIFGEFSKQQLQDIERETRRIVQFFCMKSDLARDAALPPELIYVGTEYDLDYFVAINKERMQYKKMIEISIEHSVNECREKLFQIQTQIAYLETELKQEVNALPYLQEGLARLLNEHHLRLVKHDAAFPLGDALFVIEAWVPKTRIQSLQGLLSGFEIAAEEIRIEPHEQPPTCMENKGVGKLGEDLVHIYDTPSPTDKDPSSWVMVFFAVFFAMIVSDAGYGLIFLLIALLLKYKFPRLEGANKRFLKTFFIVSIASILWGVGIASFFGIPIGPDNPFRKTSILHSMAVRKAEYHIEMKDDTYEEWVRQYPAVATATDGHDFLVKASHTTPKGEIKYDALTDFYDSILMEISLLMGIFHLTLSFLRYVGRNLSGIGWIVFMMGGYLFFPSVINATVMANILHLIPKPTAHAIGLQLVYGGIGLAFIFSFIQKKWAAFHEIMNVVQVFSDVLSYLRLYALGLAGMIMAETFNEMGENAGLIAGLFIIIAGHLVNLSLSTMGAVIHSLRLNFLEWYHYSFEGGGRLFNPLRLYRK